MTRRSYLSFMTVREKTGAVTRSAELTKLLILFRSGMLYHQTWRTNPFVQLCPMGGQGNLVRPCRCPSSPFLLPIRGDPTHPNWAPRPGTRRGRHPLTVPRAATRGEGDVNGAERRDWRYTRTKGQDRRAGRDAGTQGIALSFVVSDIYPTFRIHCQRYLGYVGVSSCPL